MQTQIIIAAQENINTVTGSLLFAILPMTMHTPKFPLALETRTNMERIMPRPAIFMFK